MNIGGYEFIGPYTLNTNFRDVGAVYVIKSSNDVLDVGQTDNLGERLPDHDRKDCWLENANEQDIDIYIHTDNSEESRLSKESQLRNTLNPSCGDR